MDESSLILRLARRFFAGTMISRISGAARDIAMAVCFGSAPEIAAFMVAYRLANLFRRLFGEGNIQSGFIPYFAELALRDPKEALFFFRDITVSLVCLLVGSVIGIEAILWIFFLFTKSTICLLAMKMAPGLLFICLYALNSAFLQYHKQYFIPGIAPAIFNVVWIFAVVFSRAFPIEQAVHLLSVGVVIAFLLQWALTALQVRKRALLSFVEWRSFRVFSSHWKTLVKPLSLGVIGVGAVQINSAIDPIFARFADVSGPAYLWYAMRIAQLPIALIGISLAGALLPSLSRAVGKGDMEGYRHLLGSQMRYALLFSIFAVFGIFSLGDVGLNLLYGHGDFSLHALEQTKRCLFGYAAGLVPSILILILANAFFALKSFRIPTIASLISLGAHFLANGMMVFILQWGTLSIAISTSLAAYLNALILLFFLRDHLAKRQTGIFALKCLLAGGFACFFTQLFIPEIPARSLLLQIEQFCLPVVAFGSVFALLAYILNILRVKELLQQSR